MIRICSGAISGQYDMHSTGIRITDNDEQWLVQGYDNGKEEPFRNYGGYRSAPGLNSTVEDMLKFIRVNLAGQLASVRLAQQARFRRDDGDSIALGWMTENKNGHRMIYHSGRGSGITSLCTLHPEWKSGMIIFSNNSNSEGNLFRLEEAIAAALRPKKNIKR